MELIFTYQDQFDIDLGKPLLITDEILHYPLYCFICNQSAYTQHLQKDFICDRCCLPRPNIPFSF